MSTPRAVSMEWSCDGKAAPGERAVASSPGGFCPAPLARLEPKSASTGLYTTAPPPADGGEPVSTHRRSSAHHEHGPVPCSASALASLVDRAARSEWTHPNCWPGHDQVVWRPCSPCYLARFGDGVNGLNICGMLSSRTSSLLRGKLHALFSLVVLPSSSLPPVLLSIPPV